MESKTNPTKEIQEEKDAPIIDIYKLFQLCYAKKRNILIVWLITFALAVLYIFPIPRYYTSSLSLAPEESSGISGDIGAIASNFGINLSSGQSNDAYTPDIYPDLLTTNDFIIGLLDIPVVTRDSSKATFYTFLTEQQKSAFYQKPIYWLKSLASPKDPIKNDSKWDASNLSMSQDILVRSIRESISASVNKKTNVITVAYTSQDPMVSKIIVDSMRVRLQDLITTYRTKKARVDMVHFESLMKKAKKTYEESLRAYSSYCDSHMETVSQRSQSEKTRLQNAMNTNLEIYNTLITQYQMANAKLQERTPAFTIVNPAVVPVKPSGPKRMIFVLFMLILSTAGCILYYGRSEFLKAM